MVHLTPIVALAGGVLILIFPRLLSCMVAIECVPHGFRHPWLRAAGLAGFGIVH